MKRIWIAVFAVIVAVGATGFWWLQMRDQAPAVLTVAAGEDGSDAHTLLSELAEVLERRDAAIRLDIRSNRSASRAVAQLSRGNVDMAVIEANTPAYAGIDIVADLFKDHFLFVSRRSADGEAIQQPGVRQGLARMEDLPGRRVAVPPPGTVGYSAFWSMVSHYRIAPESFRALTVPRSGARRAFIRGEVDAIFVLSSLRDPFVLQLVEEAALRGIDLAFIEIDQAAAMALKRPYIDPGTIVRGAFDGAVPLPRADITVPRIQRVLVARHAVSQDAVRALVRAFEDYRLDMVYRMPLAASVGDPRSSGSVTLALHPGAQSFYDRNEPSFLQENAEPLALGVTVLALLFSALLGLRRQLTSRAKNRADVYNTRLLAIARGTRAETDLTVLRALRDQLTEVLEEAVAALDEDRVTEEGFQSFSMLYSSVREALSERIRDMREREGVLTGAKVVPR